MYVALLYSKLQLGHCLMNDIKLKFNDISLYTKNDFELRRFVSMDTLYYTYIVISYY